MKIAKMLTVFLCAGMLGALNLAADEDNDGDDMRNIKTMAQAWKAACEQFGDDQEAAKKTMEFYKANFSDKINYLEKDLKDAPGEVVEQLKGDLAECGQLLSLKDENPEEFKKQLEFIRLEMKTELLGERIQDLKEQDAAKNKAEIEKIGKDLKAELERLFDMKLKKEKEELKNLEGEVEKMKQHISQREKNKEKIIEKKLMDLSGDEENLEF